MHSIDSHARHRILVMDGAMGTSLQALDLTENTWRGTRLATHTTAIKGCYDVLSLTAPRTVAQIHAEFLDAGADIITTNSFCSDPGLLSRYGLGELAAEISGASARVARETVDRWTASHPGQHRWVAGSIGPSAETAAHAIEQSGYIRADALLRGGADMLLAETLYDVPTALPLLRGVRRAITDCGRDIPLMISVTLTDKGLLPSGHTPADAIEALLPSRPWSVGINCGTHAGSLTNGIAALQSFPTMTSCHPSAGTPDQCGHYSISPDELASIMRGMLIDGMLNIAGGCCGTTPAHIRAIAAEASQSPPRKIALHNRH